MVCNAVISVLVNITQIYIKNPTKLASKYLFNVGIKVDFSIELDTIVSI